MSLAGSRTHGQGTGWAWFAWAREMVPRMLRMLEPACQWRPGRSCHSMACGSRAQEGGRAACQWPRALDACRPGQQGHRGWCHHKPGCARVRCSISCTAGFAGAQGMCEPPAIAHKERMKRVHVQEIGQEGKMVGDLPHVSSAQLGVHHALGVPPDGVGPFRAQAFAFGPSDGLRPHSRHLTRPLAPNAVPSSKQQAGLWPVPSPSRLKQPTDHASTTFRLMPPAAWQGPKEKAAHARAKSRASKGCASYRTLDLMARKGPGISLRRDLRVQKGWKGAQKGRETLLKPAQNGIFCS